MELKPITRQERIIAGNDLEPITRIEKFLKQYGGGAGGNGSGGGASVQPDLAQNDPTAPDYVKNRTHWAEDEEYTLFSYDTPINYTRHYDSWLGQFQEGETIGVRINGEKYYRELKRVNSESEALYVGNQSIWDYGFSESITSDEPFLVYFGTDKTVAETTIEADRYLWDFIKKYKSYHPLDIGYIPDQIRNAVPFLYSVITEDGESGDVYDFPENAGIVADPFNSSSLVVKVVDLNANMCYTSTFVTSDLSEWDDSGTFRIRFSYGNNLNDLKSMTIIHTYGERPHIEDSGPQ